MARFHLQFFEFAPGRYSFEPQKSHACERKQIEQQVQSPKSSGGGFDAGAGLAAALGAAQNQAGAKKILSVKIHFGLEFHLPAQILAPRGINHLGQPPADRLNSQIDFQITWNRSSRWSLHHHKKSSETYIGMRP